MATEELSFKVQTFQCSYCEAAHTPACNPCPILSSVSQVSCGRL